MESNAMCRIEGHLQWAGKERLLSELHYVDDFLVEFVGYISVSSCVGIISNFEYL